LDSDSDYEPCEAVLTASHPFSSTEESQMLINHFPSALLLASGMALVLCPHISAQTFRPGPRLSEGSMPPNLEQTDAFNWYSLNSQEASFDRQFGGRQVSVSRVVSLHQLEHQVPGRAAKEYQRALKARNKGDNEQAIAHFQRAISADPEFSAALNDLGATYFQLGKIDTAIEQFKQAINVDPHAAMPCSNLAVAYLWQQQYRDAERVARRAVDLDRGSTHNLLVLGVSLVLEGRFTSETERLLTRAASEFTLGKFWLAAGFIQKGDVSRAKDELRAYLAEAGRDSAPVASTLLRQLDFVAEGQRLQLTPTYPSGEEE
jgi:tetratricopeptide (TPR) repeat protein